MTQDDETIQVYGHQAARYAEIFADPAEDGALVLFLDHLQPHATLLDLGCGPGFAAAHMAGLGHTVMAIDATPEMVEMASRLPGVAAKQATFDDVTEEEAYDGIWANFSLLHAPRADLPRHLAALARALRPGGIFHIGMKTGTGEKRDSLGRRYTYVTKHELTDLLQDAGPPLSLIHI